MLDSVGQALDAIDEAVLVNRIDYHSAFSVSDSDLRAVLIKNWFAHAPKNFVVQKQSVVVPKGDGDFESESESQGGNDFNEKIVWRAPCQVFSAKAKAQRHLVDACVVPKLDGENIQDAIVNRRENRVAETNRCRWNNTIQAPDAEHGRLKSRYVLGEACLRKGLHRVRRLAEAQG